MSFLFSLLVIGIQKAASHVEHWIPNAVAADPACTPQRSHSFEASDQLQTVLPRLDGNLVQGPERFKQHAGIELAFVHCGNLFVQA
jgi:hypothetical protein